MASRRVLGGGALLLVCAAPIFAAWAIGGYDDDISTVGVAVEAYSEDVAAELSLDPRITATEPTALQARWARNALRRAIRAYPPGFLKARQPYVVLVGELTIMGFEGGGTVRPPDSILLATHYLLGPLGAADVQRLFHHEFSSLLLAETAFPEKLWRQALPEGFSFPQTDEERLAAATKFASDLEPYHARGFVNDYGASSFENDVNTYAEFLMNDPSRLARLAADYPKIAAKTDIIRRFYESQHPGFVSRFAVSGLGER